MSSERAILIIKTSSLGDIIHTLPALTDAHAADPNIRFDWVVEEAFTEIPGWHPAVGQVLPVALRRWRKNVIKALYSGQWSAFRRQLKAKRYEAVIDAQGLIKSAALSLSLKAPVYGPDRRSARDPRAALFYSHPQAIPKQQHAVERTRQLFAQSLGYALPDNQGEFALCSTELAAECTVRPSEPYLVFAHATTWVDKHWPEPYWCTLANIATEQGYTVCLPWNSPKEHARALRIAGDNPRIRILPQLSLRAIASVLAGADRVVAVDTGLCHLTAALDVPCVSLYGPTSPLLIGAYGARQRHLTLDECGATDDRLACAEPAIFRPMTPKLVWRALLEIRKESH